MPEKIQRPKVGVGVIVKNNGKVLMGTRLGSHGDGSWCFPGGHLEFNESIEDCARRETMEEVGIKIKNIKKVYFTNDIFLKEKVHFVTLFIVSDYDSGEVKVMEPEKCDKWDWFDWDNLPKPLFIPIENLLKENFNPFNF
jgi:8-oxo-dGTP diphosphatase